MATGIAFRAAALAACFALTLGAALAQAQDHVPGQMLVRWQPGLKPGAQADAMAPLGAMRLARYDGIGVELLRVDGMAVEEAVARLAQDPRVEYAEPDYIQTIDRTPNDPRYPEQYGLHNDGQTGGAPGDDIGAERAWDKFTGDPELLIGDIDTGAEYDHPDLAQNIWTNPGEIPDNHVDDDGNGYVDDVHGYDFLNHDGDPRDDNGHGTHTAGTIAAAGNNGLGVAGVVWRAKIVVLKFLGASGAGPTSAAIEALQYATRLGIRVTNNSWGGGVYSRALEDAIAAAGAAGALFVAAAGNSRADTDRTPQYPGALPEDCIVTVAATDNIDQLATFSNFGATTVDLAAPGVDVLSTYMGDGYRTLSGTSMATPHVTGAAAFLMGRFPGMDAAHVKARLLQFTDPVPGLAGRCLSGGRLDLALASADPDSIAPGAVSDLQVTRPGSNSFDLAWTATGDDSTSGTPSRYEIRYATHTFGADEFETATPVLAPSPLASGSPQAWHVNGLDVRTHYWFALRARDEFGNAGPVSNVVDGMTLEPARLTLSPAEVSAAATTGGVVSRTVELANDSPGTLEWSAPAPVLEFSTTPGPEGARGASAVAPSWPDDPAVKGVDGPARGPQIEAAGGPDAFGYRWTDSNEPGGPAFQWVDIVQPANVVQLSGDEGLSAALPVGFSFPLYGRRFSKLRVCTNGYLQFGTEGPQFANRGLPSTLATRNLIAPFWDDLHFGTGVNRVYAHNDGTRLIVTFDGVPRYNEPAALETFQCILYPSGEIRFQYLHMLGTTNNATVGIQDSSRTVGLLVAFNQDYLRDGLAVRIVPLRQWLSVSPPSGFLLPGERQTVTLNMDASGLATGTYVGRARIASNDPSAPDTAVRVALTATGASDIVLSPSALDFGTHFIGARDTLPLTVANVGVDPLDVSSVHADRPDFAVAAESFRLLPGEATTVTVAFTPGSIADLSGVLTLASNDPDRPLATVALHGVGSAAPVIEAAQTLLATAATPGLTPDAAVRERPLVLRNTGGAPLVWRASAYQGQIASAPAGGEGSATASSRATAAVRRPAILQIKGAVGPGVGGKGDGGPDAFGYHWVDSDAPNGPVFAWEEIATVGVRLFGGADDSTTRVALPFPFSFYGTAYDSVSVCTNGFLSFVGRDSALVNTDLPNPASGVPRALVAPFWTDLDLRSVRGSGRVYSHFDGSKLIVEWKDAVHFGGAGPYTFQVLLWPSGVIEYQYQALGALLNQATIGIQDETGTVGLRVVYNAIYAHPGLRVRLSHQDDWLSVDRLSGSIPPGSSDTLHVRFDARQYKDGEYAGELRIESNDVAAPHIAVPCALHVGLLRDPADPQPGQLAAVSEAPVVVVRLSSPPSASDVLAGSLRWNGTPISPRLPVTHSPEGRVLVSFAAVDLLARSGDAPRSKSTLTGEYDAGGWFEADLALQLVPPALEGGPLPAFFGGGAAPEVHVDDTVALTWSVPAEGADRYDVAWTADGGIRWRTLASATGPSYALVPPDTSSSALVEIVARRGDAVVGTWLSAPFVVLPSTSGGPGVPTRFALRITSATPGRDGARFSLELPAPGNADVAVFDLRGARVAQLVRGPLPSGRHVVVWDGLDARGSRAAPGVYLVRARHATGSATLRVISIR